MASKFRISITRLDGDPVHLVPGGHGERDLIAAILDAAIAKGVGLFRTEAHVRADLEAAVEEVLTNLKSEVRPTR